MDLNQIRECMYEMTNYENLSNSMYEIMQKEGFLPETLDEGDTYENHFSAMMEDDDMCKEMFEAVSQSEECSSFINEWADENYSPFLEEEPIDELSPDVKYAAHNTAMLRYPDQEKNGDDMGRIKSMNQADTFAKHVQPEIKQMVDKVADAFGNNTKGHIEKSVQHGGEKPFPYAMLIFHNYGNHIKIAVTKKGNKIMQGTIPDNVKPMIGRLVKDIQTKELPDESMDMAPLKEMGTDESHVHTVSAQHMRQSDPFAKKFLNKEGWEGSPMLTKQIDEEPEGHMYIARLHRMKDFIEEILNNITPDEDLDAWVQDKITMSYQNLEGVSLYLSGEEESGTNTPETNGIEIEMPNTSLVSALAENELPKFPAKKGKNVDIENKKNSSKEDKDGMKDANKSQKTIQQKVEDNIDVKFSPEMESKDQKDINKTYLGAWNMLNLDFQNGVPDSYKKRVELEVTTGHSRKRDEAKFGKEANVDHESTERIGKAMMDASKLNQPARDDMYNPNPIITQPYQKTSITGGDKRSKGENPGGKINEQLDRIKKIMGK